MQNIIPVDFIDVSKMAGALVLKHAVHFRDDTRRQDYDGSPHHDTQTILLRGPAGNVSRETWFSDVEHADTPLLESWPSARELIAKISESHQRRSGLVPQFGKIMVVSLKPGGFVDWHVDQGEYADAHDRFHLCLVPSVGSALYSGMESLVLQWGTLAFFNNHALHSAVNFGQSDRIHLIFDVRRVTETVQ